MRILSLCLFGILLFSACEGGTRERRAARGADYVSDPDHLYFRNVRSRDYRATSLAEGVESYRHDDLADSGPALEIRDHWIEDRAELYVAGRLLEVPAARAYRDSLNAGKLADRYPVAAHRKAAAEVLDDYLRMVGR